MSFGYLWPQLYLAEAHCRAHRKTACFGLCCSLSVFPRFSSCLLWIWGDRRPHFTSQSSNCVWKTSPRPLYRYIINTHTQNTHVTRTLPEMCLTFLSLFFLPFVFFSFAPHFFNERRCSTVSFHVAIGVRWKCIIRRLFPDNLSSLVEEIASLQ